MRIVNPTFGLVPAGAETAARRTVNWREDPLILFSNSKPNAKDLLEGIRERLTGIRRVDNVDYVQKNSVATPAPAELIDKIARDYRIALLAIAD